MRMSLWYFIILKIILIFKSIPGQLFCRRLLEIINRMISLVPARKEKIIKASQLKLDPVVGKLSGCCYRYYCGKN